MKWEKTNWVFSTFGVVEVTINHMNTVHIKGEILESLGILNQSQTETVWQFIRALLHTRQEEEDYAHFKQRAMTEIQKALGETS